ncbi:hypothetical protein D3C71_380410 [compost metagenome]
MGTVAHRRGDLFKRRSGLLDRGGLLLRTSGQIVGRMADLGSAGIDIASIVAHLRQRAVQLADRGVEVFAQSVEFGHERRIDAVLQVAIGKMRQALRQFVHGKAHICRIAGGNPLAFAALALRKRTRLLCIPLKAQALDRIRAEHGNGCGHGADLVAAVLAGNGRVEIAARKLFHGSRHRGHRRDNDPAKQCRQENHHGDNGKQRRNRGSEAEFARRRIGIVLVDNETKAPVGTRKTTDRHKADQLALVADCGFRNLRTDARRICREEVGKRLVDEGRIGMDQDLACLVDEEGMAPRTSIDRLDRRYQRV